MASLNKVQLIGNCGRDPEIRYLPSGKAACEISIATTSSYKDKNTGEKVETTEWHRVKFFDKLAEIAGEYVKKGSPLYVEGRLKYGKFKNKEGHEQNTCDIIADSMQLLGGKSSDAPRQSAPKQAPKNSGGSSGFDEMDGDIPFRDPMANRAFALSI